MILKPGVNEAITSRAMGQRFENLGLGGKLNINKIDFTIVGYFAAEGSAAESEVWTELGDLTAARRTPAAVSIVNLRAMNEESKQALIQRIAEDEQFNLKVIDEPRYYADQMTASIAIKIVGFFIAAFLTFGAMFAAANTMYAAVASRSREIGTLRAIGFRRRSILFSFLLESVLLCLIGGILGCLLTLPFNGLSTGTANWATFSEITFSFRFGWEVMLQGLGLALAMGVLGGLFPAIRAVRLNTATALAGSELTFAPRHSPKVFAAWSQIVASIQFALCHLLHLCQKFFFWGAEVGLLHVPNCESRVNPRSVGNSERAIVGDLTSFLFDLFFRFVACVSECEACWAIDVSSFWEAIPQVFLAARFQA